MKPKVSCISSIFSPCIKKNETQIYSNEKMFCQKENLRRKKSHTFMLNFFLKLKFVRRKNMISLLFHRPQCRIVHQQLLKKTSDLTVFISHRAPQRLRPETGKIFTQKGTF